MWFWPHVLMLLKNTLVKNKKQCQCLEAHSIVLTSSYVSPYCKSVFLLKWIANRTLNHNNNIFQSPIIYVLHCLHTNGVRLAHPQTHITNTKHSLIRCMASDVATLTPKSRPHTRAAVNCSIFQNHFQS